MTSSTADARDWFSKPLPLPSSCGWMWDESSELAAGKLWTEAAEHSLVKCSAQWHFSFGLKNLGMQQPICCEMISEALFISSLSPLGFGRKTKKVSQKVSSNDCQPLEETRACGLEGTKRWTAVPGRAEVSHFSSIIRK